MKLFTISVLLTFGTIQSHSQLLQGRWEGTFSDNYGKYPIYLDFILNGDTTYSVYSYSTGFTLTGKDTSITCLVYYELISQDSLYLEEIEVVGSEKYRSACFQKMYLKITRKEDRIKISGRWKSSSTNCDLSGKITFHKSK